MAKNLSPTLPRSIFLILPVLIATASLIGESGREMDVEKSLHRPAGKTAKTGVTVEPGQGFIPLIISWTVPSPPQATITSDPSAIASRANYSDSPANEAVLKVVETCNLESTSTSLWDNSLALPSPAIGLAMTKTSLPIHTSDITIIRITIKFRSERRSMITKHPDAKLLKYL